MADGTGADIGSASGGVLVAVGFTDPALAGDPTWTALSGVQSVDIDRGRVYEFDKTGPGTATINLVDTTGAYDPTVNPNARPLKQIKVELTDPANGGAWMLFRGFVSAWNCEPDTKENVLHITIECVDALDIFAALELVPDSSVTPVFGDTVPNNSVGDVYYAEDTTLDAVQTRINKVLDEVGWDATLRSIFTGNVGLQEAVYAYRSSALSVIMDCADAEFPVVANFYMSKTGVATFHGRFARFNPGNPDYDIEFWHVGDLAAANISPTTVVPISDPLTYSVDKENLFSAAIATPKNVNDEDIEAQYVSDATAITAYGMRTWSAEDLLTLTGDNGRTALEETALMADYIVDNMSTPRLRVGEITVRPQPPAGTYGAATWALISRIEISDVVYIKTSNVGGGGFNNSPFYTEGIHYRIVPMTSSYPEVTMTLDVSPSGYYDSNPFERTTTSIIVNQAPQQPAERQQVALGSRIP